jgi:sulfatase maturation enzyme AslB (radical SAM superfamily)
MERDTLTLYTTAVCNLNCSYCYIDKNESLIAIDEMLDKSFIGDYYFNFAKDMF